jgi:hypothetical protein
MTSGVLVSLWYYRNYNFDTIPREVKVILDSGAFSAYTSGGSVDPQDYADWMTRLAGRFEFAFNLDVLGDNDASFAAWEDLRGRGHETVPVIHYGTRAQDALPRYLDAGATRLACGGIVVSGAGPQVMSWIAHVFKWLRDNGHDDIPVHGLGLHMRSKLAVFPWATTDSSHYTAAWRFARLSLWDRRSGHEAWRGIRLDGKQPYRHGPALAAYGVGPEQIERSTPANRDVLVRLATRSEVYAAEAWDRRRARHNGTPTTRYLVDTAADLMPAHAQEVARYLVPGSQADTPMTIATLKEPT